MKILDTLIGRTNTSLRQPDGCLIRWKTGRLKRTKNEIDDLETNFRRIKVWLCHSHYAFFTQNFWWMCAAVFFREQNSNLQERKREEKALNLESKKKIISINEKKIKLMKVLLGFEGRERVFSVIWESYFQFLPNLSLSLFLSINWCNKKKTPDQCDKRVMDYTLY